MHIQRYTPMNKQKGSVLIVALVMLVVITLIGAASIRTSTMELKMVSSQRDRDAAFAAAEMGLKSAEAWLEENKPTNAQLRDTKDCADKGVCFEKSCAGGLCFDGQYSAGDSKINCKVGEDGVEPTVFWRDAALKVWEDTETKHKTINVEGLSTPVKYIIEFLCYVDDGVAPVFSATNPNDGLPLYRITALAEGNAKKAKVMLQSTYRLGNQ